MRIFSGFIASEELIDLLLISVHSLGLKGGIVLHISQLDRFLVSEDCEDAYQDVRQSTLPRAVSDYTTIVLASDGFS